MKKIFRILSVSLLFCLCVSFLSFAGKEGLAASGSTLKGITWKYYTGEDDENGYPRYLKNQWRQFESGWCYFGEDGLTMPGSWALINEKWYYFDENSLMLHDTTTPDGYTVGSDGAWVKDGQVVVETVANN